MKNITLSFFFTGYLQHMYGLKTMFVGLFTGKYKDNEAIEFSFDLNRDVPEDVAQEMVCVIKA